MVVKFFYFFDIYILSPFNHLFLEFLFKIRISHKSMRFNYTDYTHIYWVFKAIDMALTLMLFSLEIQRELISVS